MGQDIRDMMKDHTPEQPKLSEGHEARFEKKLQQAFPAHQKDGQGKHNNASFYWLKIAAAIMIFLGAGYFAYQQWDGVENTEPVLVNNEGVNETGAAQFTLGDLSPDLKKVEEFYTNGINIQLASLHNDTDNKELIDGYLKQINELNKEYELLNKELNEVGPTEATITALIDNLKLRLELLFKLKNKLKELKQLENEQFNDITV
jgi:archaellum component FlaC